MVSIRLHGGESIIIYVAFEYIYIYIYIRLIECNYRDKVVLG